METKGNVCKIDKLGRKLSFEKWEVVEAIGFFGGMIMIWKEDANIELY